MSKPLIVVILLVAGFIAYSGGHLDRFINPSGPGPVTPGETIVVQDDITVPAPSPATVALFNGKLDEITRTGATVPKKEKVLTANFYRDFADIVVSEPGAVTSITQTRNAIMKAGTIKFRRLGISRDYREFALSIEAALIAGIGVREGPIDEAKKQQIKDVLYAVAHTIYNA